VRKPNNTARSAQRDRRRFLAARPVEALIANRRGAKRLLVASVLTLPLALPAAAVSAPPRFSRWLAVRLVEQQRDLNRTASSCEKSSRGNDVELGSCIVAHQRVTLRIGAVAWERQVAAISRGQSVSCSRSIRDSSAAVRARERAILAYLGSHPRVAAKQLVRDLHREPYTTLSATTGALLLRAVRICG
jgi:hypothetical protein